jgi:dTDP-4-amino-4,6-dideoxygalactose transaminase
MVEPVLAVSATPVLYRIRQDLAIDLEDIQTRLTGSTRAILVPHYFGFLQDMPVIRRFCDAHELILIEDCAHAFFGRVHGHPVGWYGDYAIASIKKFFPVFDGGYLISSRRSLRALQLGRGGWRYDMRSAAIVLENAVRRRS